MNYNTVYVGMDVHKESFTLCAYTIEAEKASHFQRTTSDYKNILKNHLSTALPQGFTPQTDKQIVENMMQHYKNQY